MFTRFTMRIIKSSLFIWTHSLSISISLCLFALDDVVINLLIKVSFIGVSVLINHSSLPISIKSSIITA